MLIKGSINAAGFEQWLKQWLMLELHPDSTLIIDNAPIHRKSKIEEIVEARGHQVLFLPKYSPDFNQIEHDFAAMKKRRKYAPQDTDVDRIVKDYSERDRLSKLI
jgi:transposase